MDLRMPLYGVIGGLYAAACMSALRLAARRLGIVDEPVPDVVEAWAAQELKADSSSRLGHQVLAQVLHLGVGAMAGAMYGSLTAKARGRGATSGILFGLGVWAVAFTAVTPLLGIARPAWRSRSTENAINVAAHILYGAVTALVTGELATDPQGPRSRLRRHALRMG